MNGEGQQGRGEGDKHAGILNRRSALPTVKNKSAYNLNYLPYNLNYLPIRLNQVPRFFGCIRSASFKVRRTLCKHKVTTFFLKFISKILRV